MPVMTKEELIQQIKKTVEEMSQATELCGSKPIYMKSDEEMMEININDLRKANSWLQDVHERQWKTWKKIRNHQSEDRWKWYDLDPASYSDLPESMMHSCALKNLKTALLVKRRPEIFRKGKVRGNKSVKGG